MRRGAARLATPHSTTSITETLSVRPSLPKIRIYNKPNKKQKTKYGLEECMHAAACGVQLASQHHNTVLLLQRQPQPTVVVFNAPTTGNHRFPLNPILGPLDP